MLHVQLVGGEGAVGMKPPKPRLVLHAGPGQMLSPVPRTSVGVVDDNGREAQLREFPDALRVRKLADQGFEPSAFRRQVGPEYQMVALLEGI